MPAGRTISRLTKAKTVSSTCSTLNSDSWRNKKLNNEKKNQKAIKSIPKQTYAWRSFGRMIFVAYLFL